METQYTINQMGKNGLFHRFHWENWLTLWRKTKLNYSLTPDELKTQVLKSKLQSQQRKNVSVSFQGTGKVFLNKIFKENRFKEGKLSGDVLTDKRFSIHER